MGTRVDTSILRTIPVDINVSFEQWLKNLNLTFTQRGIASWGQQLHNDQKTRRWKSYQGIAELKDLNIIIESLKKLYPRDSLYHDKFYGTHIKSSTLKPEWKALIFNSVKLKNQLETFTKESGEGILGKLKHQDGRSLLTETIKYVEVICDLAKDDNLLDQAIRSNAECRYLTGNNLTEEYNRKKKRLPVSDSWEAGFEGIQIHIGKVKSLLTDLKISENYVGRSWSESERDSLLRDQAVAITLRVLKIKCLYEKNHEDWIDGLKRSLSNPWLDINQFTLASLLLDKENKTLVGKPSEEQLIGCSIKTLTDAGSSYFAKSIEVEALKAESDAILARLMK